MKLRHSLFIIFSVLLTFSVSAFAGNDHVETDKNGVILAGYDAVAYFTQNAAIEGSAEFTATHNGAIYRFSSSKNRDLFTDNPEKFEPQYGGFCAYGAALGKKFEVNGKAFEIVDGKLYVNKNEDVYEVWEEDKSENIVTADQQWKVIKAVAASKL
ncbi:YHS domain-containing (seleno)protein [Arenicella sp. 4NH20-0111]|uniref:YHS domain-containing (seleno)protein n=1 Tax=Arenicella sp. 4NH20-0111 TaxID=3127648 RepID=UPI0031049AB5